MKTKLLKESTHFRYTHVSTQRGLSMLGSFKTLADLSRPSFRSFMNSSFEASPISHTSAIQSFSTSLLSLPDEPPSCSWWVASQSTTQAGRQHTRREMHPAMQTLYLQGASSSHLSSLGSDCTLSHDPFVSCIARD